MPRLNGRDIERDMPRLLGLVQKGIAGFIIFGGELEEVRSGISRLQAESTLPLIIGSDLEQGLGQQLSGGTLFPPAMAVARAGELMDAAFRQMADEAAYAGINAIFAPVLDVNTNPQNPIICTRAFGGDIEIVTNAAIKMIHAFQSRGITACGKHFPGHGDTQTDSHIQLPVVRKSLDELESLELIPFKRAIDAGVGMIMIAHMSVPALDPTGTPVSLSSNAVQYLRQKMGYDGILITDAMNMGGLGGYSQKDAALMSMRAGVDIILHPEEPERLANALAPYAAEFDGSRLIAFRKSLRIASIHKPSFDPAISLEITERAINISGDVRAMRNPHVLVLNDAGDETKGAEFITTLKENLPSLGVTRYSGQGDLTIPPDADIISAIFSPIRAWKGGASGWIEQELKRLSPRLCMVVSFGSPYILSCAPEEATKACTYWDSEAAQRAMARALLRSVI